MKKVFIFFSALIISLIGLFDIRCIYADDMSNEQKKQAAYIEKVSGTEPAGQEKTENNVRTKSDNAEVFSEYPKHFIIPRGVCETNKPAMVIER